MKIKKIKIKIKMKNGKKANTKTNGWVIKSI